MGCVYTGEEMATVKTKQAVKIDVRRFFNCLLQSLSNADNRRVVIEVVYWSCLFEVVLKTVFSYKVTTSLLRNTQSCLLRTLMQDNFHRVQSGSVFLVLWQEMKKVL